MNCEDIDYTFVASQIPRFMQSLYVESILNSTSLKEIRDAFRPHQLQCKSWLIDNIKNIDKDSKILVIGSWLGFTSYCLYRSGFQHIEEVDPESRLEQLACHANRENTKFKHYSDDVNNLDLSKYDMIINTSCEHIGNDSWFNRIDNDCLIVLHSTNMKWHDHVNTVENLQQMKNKYPMNYNYSGELVLTPMYSRFMLIGKK